MSRNTQKLQQKELFKGFSLVLVIVVLSISYSIAQNPMLKTLPDHAKVLTTDDVLIGETPIEISKIVAKGKKIKIKLEGYRTVFINFPEKQKKVLSFPSCIYECSDCPISFDNFPNDKQENFSGTLILRKDFDDNIEALPACIDTPKLGLSADYEFGRINGSTKKLSNKDIHTYLGYVENMDLQAMQAFEGSYIEPVYISKSEKEKTNLYRPKIILKPVIKKLTFEFRGSLLRDYTGPCLMECDWQVSTLGERKKVIATFPVKTSVYRSANNYEIILHEMIAASERDLLANDTLYTFLKKVEKQYFSSLKSDPFPLKVPVKKTYESQKEMLKQISQAVVTIETKDGFGSGALISEEGFILTNYHVVEDSGTIYVKIANEKKIVAEIVKVCSDFDLALLKIPPTSIPAISIGDSKKSSSGDNVFAIGTPLDKSLSQTVTKGIISGYREWNGVNFIQTDVSINSGNSGGPLVNEEGELVAITTLKFSGKGIQGIGFCIPSQIILEKMNLQKK